MITHMMCPTCGNEVFGPLTIPDDVRQIATWLDGLEETLENVIRISRDPIEVETMKARRGMYVGIAAEVRGGNWRKLR